MNLDKVDYIVVSCPFDEGPMHYVDGREVPTSGSRIFKNRGRALVEKNEADDPPVFPKIAGKSTKFLDVFYRRYIFKWLFSHGHIISFRGCKYKRWTFP